MRSCRKQEAIRYCVLVASMSVLNWSCFARATNSACTSVSKSWFFTDPVNGSEKILAAPTFANLAAADQKNEDVNHQTLVESGTRYFLYDVKSQGNYSKFLALLENGLCVYLSKNDVTKYSYTAEALRISTGQDFVAFFSENVPEKPCTPTPINVTSGMVLGVLNDGEPNQNGDVTAKVDSGGLKCDVSISSSLAKIVDTRETIDWSKKGAFQLARFSNVIGRRKDCPYRLTDVSAVEVKIGEEAKLGISTPGVGKYFPEIKIGA